MSASTGRPHPTEEDAAARIRAHLVPARRPRHRGTHSICPLMSDPVILATLDVLTKVGAGCMLTDANPHCPVHLPRGQSEPGTRQQRRVLLRLCRLAHQLPDRTSATTRPAFGSVSSAYDLVEQRGIAALRSHDIYVVRQFVMLWTQTCASWPRFGPSRVRCRERNRRSYTCATYSCGSLITNLLAAGDPLVEVQREAEEGLAFAQKVGSVS